MPFIIEGSEVEGNFIEVNPKLVDFFATFVSITDEVMIADSGLTVTLVLHSIGDIVSGHRRGRRLFLAYLLAKGAGRDHEKVKMVASLFLAFCGVMIAGIL
jgi:hypothetical protein